MERKYHNTAGCYLLRKINHKTEILLIYKKWAEDNQGYVPPKGHVEDGETLVQAAIRETTEETGYKNIKIIEKLETLHIEYPWDDGYIHVKHIHYFLSELIDDEMVELKLSEQEKSNTVKVEWMTLDEAEKKMMFDDEREILRNVRLKMKN